MSGADRWRTRADAVWRHVEPYHAVVYFAPEHRAACDAAGLRGGWMAYFASRAAPLGPVAAEVVAALFYNFHPAMVSRALPDAWSHAAPERVLEARAEGVGRALRRILGEAALRDLERAVDLARSVVGGDADVGGRPVFAANLALSEPDAPELALWRAATLLREHRGDGHVAVLVAEGIDPCAAHVLQVAAGVIGRAGLQPHRGWSDDDWAAATATLAERGLVDPDGRITAAGRTLRRHIEDRTNDLAAVPLRRAGSARVEEFLDAVAPVTRTVVASGAIPYPNPMGVPEP